MVARGFEHTATKNDIKNMATKSDIARLEQGQEEIKLKLDNVPFDFSDADTFEKSPSTAHANPGQDFTPLFLFAFATPNITLKICEISKFDET